MIYPLEWITAKFLRIACGCSVKRNDKYSARTWDWAVLDHAINAMATKRCGAAPFEWRVISVFIAYPRQRFLLFCWGD
jgi:hypothetical protein